MKEIEIGIRIRPGEGICFFGTKEVNELLGRGARVVAIEPGTDSPSQPNAARQPPPGVFTGG